MLRVVLLVICLVVLVSVAVDSAVHLPRRTGARSRFIREDSGDDNEWKTLNTVPLRRSAQFSADSSTSDKFMQQDYGEMQGDMFRRPVPREENVTAFVKRASAASVAVLFGLLVWRSLSSYELADQFSSTILRVTTLVSVVAVLTLNAGGLIVSLAKPLDFKNQLKAVLALNILREWLELAYNVVMVLLGSSRLGVPREVYVGRIFMNIWWSLLCFSFSKSRWVLSAPSSLPPREQF
jgi:hypothetical protein